MISLERGVYRWCGLVDFHWATDHKRRVQVPSMVQNVLWKNKSPHLRFATLVGPGKVKVYLAGINPVK